jgi:hypothetical protein
VLSISENNEVISFQRASKVWPKELIITCLVKALLKLGHWQMNGQMTIISESMVSSVLFYVINSKIHNRIIAALKDKAIL